MKVAAPPGSRKGQRTRARLVGATASLLQARGYHAVGLNEIVERSGAPRGSLYFYFPAGKQALACCALEASGREWRQLVDAAVRAASDLPTALAMTCRALGERLVASGYAHGCPVATVALESATSADAVAVRQVCATHYEQLIALLIRHLRRARGAPPRSAGASRDARSLAVLLVSALEGALLLCKVGHNLAPLHSVAASLEPVLRGWSAAESTSPRRQKLSGRRGKRSAPARRTSPPHAR